MWQHVWGGGASNWWFALVSLLSLNLKSLQLRAVPNLEACGTVARFPVPSRNCAKYGSEGMKLPDVQKNRDAVCAARSHSQWNGVEGNLGAVIGYDESVAWGNGARIFFKGYWLIFGDRGSTVVKVLCYKSEGRWFDPSWCHWNFSLT